MAPSATTRARSLVRTGRDAEARRVLEDRLHAHPEDIEARRLLVRVLAVSGSLVEARAQVNELAARLPSSDPTADIELGHALELSHRYDEALDAYDDAAAIAPQSPAGPREGGVRAAHWGEAEAARPRLEEAIRRGAGDAEIWHALGLVCLHLGDVDAADRAYRAGIQVAPDSAENWLGLASVAVVRDDPAGALAAYDELLARRPRFAAAELGRSWALVRLGRRDEAAKALDRAQELGAPSANVARQRADLLK